MTDRWEILETNTETPTGIYQDHMQAFVEHFVEKQRQERWMHLLIERLKNIFKHSHKLHNDLNCNFANRQIMLPRYG